MLDYILQYPWLGALVILIAQFTFMYFRTVNVINTSEMKIKASLISGFILDIFWLMSMSIGLTAIMSGKWQPILGFLIGASLGRWYAIKLEKIRHGNKG